MRYGKNAKEVLPQLREKRPPNDPKAVKNIDKAIAAIEASTDEPTLVSLKDFIARAKTSEPKKENANR